MHLHAGWDVHTHMHKALHTPAEIKVNSQQSSAFSPWSCLLIIDSSILIQGLHLWNSTRAKIPARIPSWNKCLMRQLSTHFSRECQDHPAKCPWSRCYRAALGFQQEFRQEPDHGSQVKLPTGAASAVSPAPHAKGWDSWMPILGINGIQSWGGPEGSLNFQTQGNEIIH